MYKKTSRGWVKHLDFILLDVISLQIAFVLAYYIRHGAFLPYQNELYRDIGIIIAVLDFLVAVALNSMHNVVKRGYYKEFARTFGHCTVVVLLTILWMFSLKRSYSYSRTVIYMTYGFHIILGYGIRLFWKQVLGHRGTANSGKLSMLAVLEPDLAPKMVERLTVNPTDGYHISGVVLIENPKQLTEVGGVPVVSSFKEAANYICREWIDSVFISTRGTTPEIHEFMKHCAEMAVTIHYHIPGIGQAGNKQFVEKIGGSIVVTSSNNYVSPSQMILKRFIDIIGGMVGSLFALLIIAVIGPKIKKASPGPILYRSERIGQNGKRFKMIKIRSMYLDADERKASLMEKNRVKDGMMFKLDFDPRIIGNEELPDGTRKTGIGEFIRKTSLDEFPQFFNVLKGEMSLVGTRPPTPDEWEKYEFHHRARLSTKPGITGMWQVSGRSEITDFEEVVKLDTAYIQNWSPGLDLRILLKTVVNVFTRKGAM